jgi:hypothetical protein
MAVFRSLRYAVDACSYALGAVGAEELVLQRRAYHWRGVGKVLPNGPGYTRGTGNSRRYDESALPLIAVLLQISDKYPAIEELDAISHAIQRKLAERRTPFAQCWTAALERAAAEQEEAPPEEVEKEDHWLTIAFPSPAEDLDVRCGPTVITNKGFDVDVYALDLDFIFISLAEYDRLNS